MTGLDFFFADQNVAFLVAMAVVLLLGVIEVVGLLLGIGLSELVDNLMPDLGPPDVDLDLEAGLDAEVTPPDPGAFGHLLGWLNIGRVPFLVLLIVLLASFSSAGFLIQLAARSLGFLLPAWLVAPVALAAALPATRGASRVVGRLLPREESYAVGEDELVGRVATISLGPVDARTPGKARVVDQHGNVHYVRLRAARPGARFDLNSQVLLVRLDGSLFEAIEPPDSLADG